VGDVIIDITMSLDGFVAAPNDGPGRGLGDRGEILHYWVFGGPWTYDDRPDQEMTEIDKQVLEDAIQGGGASVVGRGMYEAARAWGGRSPFGPCVVVTHRVDDQPDPAAGFEFVDGIDAAIGRAREIAGERNVGIGGGASIIQQALQAGLVDGLRMHVAPVILGAGRTLFGELGVRLGLERTRVRESPYATHIDFRIKR
jgi:dihydrofolate reductase